MQRKSSYLKGIAAGFTKLNLNQKQVSRRFSTFSILVISDEAAHTNNAIVIKH